VLHNRQLVHPVHERMAFFHNTFQLTADTGNQLVPGKEITGIYRLLLGTQEVSLDPVLFEFDPVDKSAFLEFLDEPRTFPAVYTQLLPEFTLENTFGI